MPGGLAVYGYYNLVSEGVWVVGMFKQLGPVAVHGRPISEAGADHLLNYYNLTEY